MKKVIIIILVLLGLLGLSNIGYAVRIVSYPFPTTTNPMPTHCGFIFDGGPIKVVVVANDVTGIYCNYDLAWIPLAVGPHVVTANAIVKDSIWGDIKTDQSAPLNFNKPPTTLTTIPQNLNVKK